MKNNIMNVLKIMATCFKKKKNTFSAGALSVSNCKKRYEKFKRAIEDYNIKEGYVLNIPALTDFFYTFLKIA